VRRVRGRGPGDGVSDARAGDVFFAATGTVVVVGDAAETVRPDALIVMAVAVAAGLQVHLAWKRVVQCAAAGATVSSGFRRPVLHPTTKIPAYRRILSQDLIRDPMVRRRTRRPQRVILLYLLSLLNLLISGSDLRIRRGSLPF